MGLSEFWFGSGGATALSQMPGVVITEITEKSPAMKMIEQDRGSGIGRRLDGIQLQGAEVSVSFGLRAGTGNRAQRLAQRLAWLDAVTGVAWNTDEIRTSARPWMILRCRVLSLPEHSGAEDLAHTWTITFRAYGCGAWQEASEHQLSELGGNTGHLPCPVNWHISVSGAAASLKIGYLGKWMEFTGLGITAGAVINVWKDTDDLLHAEMKKTGQSAVSILGNRTPESEDVLMLTVSAYGTKARVKIGNAAERDAADGETWIRRRWL